MTRKFHLLSLGAIYTDINSINFPFGEGLIPEKQVIGEEYRTELGGSAVTCARVASNLGLETAFIGKVGSDYFGDLTQKLLHADTIKGTIIRSPKHHTNLGINFVNPDGQALMVNVGTANQSLKFEEITNSLVELLPQSEYLYIGGYFKLKELSQYYPEIISLAKKAGTKLILDHGRIHNAVSPEQRKQLKNIIQEFDFYLPSKDEFTTLWEVNSIEDGLKKVSSLTQATIIVKNSNEGAVTIQNEEIMYTKAFPVTPVQTVGAGDSFNAGFIKAQTLNQSLTESMLFATATSAIKISRPELPTIQQVQEMIQSIYGD